MRDFPNMTSEVVEAIHMMFEDYPDIETDCYLFMQGLLDRANMNTASVDKELQRMGRCEKCGTLLEIQNFRYLDKNDNIVIEKELYCPMCDIGNDFGETHN